MRLRERTSGGLLWALSSFVLLVGILSMHGLTAHDVGMPWMVPVVDTHEDHRQPSGHGPMGALSMAAAQRYVPSVDHPFQPTGVPSIWAIDPVGAGHGVMDLCVAVLSLLALLLFLGRVHSYARITFSERFLRSLRQMAGRAPPQDLCPSLTGLCIARV